MIEQEQDTKATEGRSSNGLPQGWVRTTLSEIAQINRRDADLRELPGDLTITFVPMAAVDAEHGRIDAREDRPLGQVRKGFTPFSDGDVLFAKITPCMENGKAAIAEGLANGRGFGSTEFHVLRPNSGVLSKWLFYFVRQQSFRDDAKANFAGTAGQLRVPGRFLVNHPIPLASTAEQERIVTAIEQQFSHIDAGIAALKQVRAKLKRYRAAVLKAAVEGTLTEAWRAEHPGVEPASDLLGRILDDHESEQRAQHRLFDSEAMRKQQDYPQLPTTWQWARVDQLGDVQLGRQRSPRHHHGAYMRPYLRVANVFEDRIDTSDVLEMNFTPDEYETYYLQYGDILLNEGQSLELVGRPAMYRDEVPGSCFQNTLVRFRAYSGVMPEFALIVFRAYLHSGRFQRIARWTTNIAHLGAGRFAQVEFPLPSLAEQEQIVAEVERRLSVVAETEAQVAAELRRAERLRQGILALAFAGKLAPQDPADEPASALLERIRAEKGQAKGGKGKPEGTARNHEELTVRQLRLLEP